MKVLFINTVCGQGSTGNIVTGIMKLLKEKGNSCKAVYGYGEAKNVEPDKAYKTVTKAQYYKHNILTRITDHEGLFSKRQTYKLIEMIDLYEPDVIHLHNLHGHYINYEILFDYLKKIDKPVVWTLHDCWAFTGHCPHFTMAGCEKWKYGCDGCTQLKVYPTCNLVGDVKGNYRRKKHAFSGVKNLTIVTPSSWLRDRVKQSFLKEYPVRVIYNGIDGSVFKPVVNDFRRKYKCENKILLLGVAFNWGIRKGIDVFAELAKRLEEQFQIVLVGTDDKIDKQLPKNIISIHKTHSRSELAEIYSAADLFINPTREEVLGLVNIEALACGTPVITFDSGGSPECIDKTCGSVVTCGDIDMLEREIRRAVSEKAFNKTDCIRRANKFNMNDRFNEYIELYNKTTIGI